jgi:hypothetical protein
MESRDWLILGFWGVALAGIVALFIPPIRAVRRRNKLFLDAYRGNEPTLVLGPRNNCPSSYVPLSRRAAQAEGVVDAILAAADNRKGARKEAR